MCCKLANNTYLHRITVRIYEMVWRFFYQFCSKNFKNRINSSQTRSLWMGYLSHVNSSHIDYILLRTWKKYKFYFGVSYSVIPGNFVVPNYTVVGSYPMFHTRVFWAMIIFKPWNEILWIFNFCRVHQTLQHFFSISSNFI